MKTEQLNREKECLEKMLQTKAAEEEA